MSNVALRCPTAAGVNRTTSRVSMRSHGEGCEIEMPQERKLLKEGKSVQFSGTNLFVARMPWAILLEPLRASRTLVHPLMPLEALRALLQNQ